MFILAWIFTIVCYKSQRFPMMSQLFCYSTFCRLASYFHYIILIFFFWLGLECVSLFMFAFSENETSIRKRRKNVREKIFYCHSHKSNVFALCCCCVYLLPHEHKLKWTGYKWEYETWTYDWWKQKHEPNDTWILDLFLPFRSILITII